MSFHFLDQQMSVGYILQCTCKVTYTSAGPSKTRKADSAAAQTKVSSCCGIGGLFQGKKKGNKEDNKAVEESSKTSSTSSDRITFCQGIAALFARFFGRSTPTNVPSNNLKIIRDIHIEQNDENARLLEEQIFDFAKSFKDSELVDSKDIDDSNNEKYLKRHPRSKSLKISSSSGAPLVSLPRTPTAQRTYSGSQQSPALNSKSSLDNSALDVELIKREKYTYPKVRRDGTPYSPTTDQRCAEENNLYRDEYADMYWLILPGRDQRTMCFLYCIFRDLKVMDEKGDPNPWIIYFEMKAAVAMSKIAMSGPEYNVIPNKRAFVKNFEKMVNECTEEVSEPSKEKEKNVCATSYNFVDCLTKKAYYPTVKQYIFDVRDELARIIERERQEEEEKKNNAKGKEEGSGKQEKKEATVP